MHAVSGDVPVARSVLPEGEAGVDATVKRMVQLAHSKWGAKSAKIRALTMNIIRAAHVPEKDYYGEIVAVHNWIRNPANIRYFRDPVGQETLADPEQTAFNLKGGDCLDGETALLTPSGRKAIKDIKVGDIIYGKDGWTEVLAWFDKGFLPVKKYVLNTGGSFIATDDHRCFMADGGEKKAGELLRGDRLLGCASVIAIQPKSSWLEMAVLIDNRQVYDITTGDTGIYLPDADVVVHNCDDKTTLEIAMLGSVGITSYPVVIGVQPKQFSHVYLYAEVPAGTHRNAGKIIPLDPIMKDWPAGKEAPAARIKAKKVYKNLSNPLTINGVPMGNLGDLGSYVTGPSYLDTEESHARELLMPDKASNYIHRDRTVANSVRATIPVEGIDGMMGNALQRVYPSGGTYTETSAGDGGTIVKQDGQLVPRGFIRDEPDRQEIMSMTPASAKRLGPLGPIIARSYAMNQRTGNIPHERATRIPSLQREMSQNIPATAVPTVIGRKRYEIPSIQQQTMAQNTTGEPYRVNFLKKPKVVTLKARQVVDLGLSAKPKTLGEAVALAEGCMGMLGAEINARIRAIPKLPAALKEKLRHEIKALRAKLVNAEQTVLALRQELRHQQQMRCPKQGIRAIPIIAQEAVAAAVPPKVSHAPMYGMGETSMLAGVTDALKSPMVYVPALAIAGYFLFRRFARK